MSVCRHKSATIIFMAKDDYDNWDKQQLIEEIRALKKRKRYGLVWEDKPEQVAIDCETNLPILKEVPDKAIVADANAPTNLIIEGDNYHALAVLNYTHKGKIDVIYIDPPYNTGKQGAEWTYNNRYVNKTDGYRHSKWLSMMEKRLALAKDLLKRDGVLICAIDENEFNRLGLLIEEIYSGHEIHCMAVVHNPRGVQGKNFAYTHEYVYFVFREKLQVIEQKKREKPLDEEFRNSGGESLRTDAKNCFYPILVNVNEKKIIEFGDVPSDDFHPAGKNVKKKNDKEVVEVWPIDRNGVERKWIFARQSVDEIKDNLWVKITKDQIDIWRTKIFQKPKTVWCDPKYDASRNGSTIANDLIGDFRFSFPKSVYAVHDCLECVIKKKQQAIVLDFFAGSGTTGHAVSLLNKTDGGNRKFVLCTNNENDIAQKACYPRIKAVIEGNAKHPDITGIASNLRYYETAFVSASTTDDNKAKIIQEMADMLCVRENTFEEVKNCQSYRIYRNANRHTGIIYAESAIDNFKKYANKIRGEFHVYVFSLGKEDYAEEFADMSGKVQTHPIPEEILCAYRQIFRKRSVK